jgi:hypothetical protein
MKLWFRNPSIEKLWLKFIESPDSGTSEEKAKLLKEGNLQLAKVLLESTQSKDSDKYFLLVMFLTLIWLMIVISVVVWYLS